MNHAHRIAARFREVILHGTWIANTNFKHQLTGLRWETAMQQVDSLNTIAVLAQHVHYYIRGISNVLDGGILEIKDRYSFEFAPIRSQEQWETFLSRFWEDSERFASQVEGLSDENLASEFVDAKYGTYERNIEGMIEHSYYHLGQIVLIKKMLDNDRQVNR